MQPVDPSPIHDLMREMGIDEANVERRKWIVGIEPRDLERIATLRELIVQNAEQLTSAFFDYLSGLEEGRTLVGDRVVAARARELKLEHLAAMVQGNYGVEYARQRLELALLYNRVGLDLRVFLAASTTCSRAPASS